MKHDNVLAQIPSLVKGLSSIKCSYPFESQLIGIAIAHLTLLKDILENQKNERTS